jgi:hypothetical protein
LLRSRTLPATKSSIAKFNLQKCRKNMDHLITFKKKMLLEWNLIGDKAISKHCTMPFSFAAANMAWSGCSLKIVGVKAHLV